MLLVEQVDERLRILPHIVACCDAVMCALAHGGALLRREADPAADEVLYAVNCVVFDESAAVTDEVSGDVDGMREQRGLAAGQSFDDGDAKVFLMRGKDEGLAGSEGSPL